MSKAYIALGSNINPKMSYLQKAINMMREHKEIQPVKFSSIYETEPVGYTEQEKFLNMVIEVETKLAPSSLLTACQSIECSLGRKREVRWGPRTIDLDILLYGQQCIEVEGLSIPHRRLHERAFVLIPLADIDPHLTLPHLNVSVENALAELSYIEKADVVKWQTFKLG